MRRIACIRLPEDDGNPKLQMPIADCQTAVNCQPQFSVVNRLARNIVARFSPILGLEPTDPQSLLLDITGLAHLFGGESGLAGEIVRDFVRLRLNIHLAVADTIGAAWAAAGKEEGKAEGRRRQGQTRMIILRISSSALIIPPGQNAAAFLRPLPIEALRLPGETVRLLAELGIFRDRPARGLAARTSFCRDLGRCCGTAWIRHSGGWTSRCRRPLPPAFRGRLVGRAIPSPAGK